MGSGLPDEMFNTSNLRFSRKSMDLNLANDE